MNRLSFRAAIETWPTAGDFTIARGTKREAIVVVVEVSDGTHVGRGECVPYARYGETPQSVFEEMISAGDLADRRQLRSLMPAGAARNALDCALWDLEAKSSGRTAADLAGLPAPSPVITAYTISLGSPADMAGRAVAAAAHNMPLLKIKLGGDGDEERMRQIRRACPNSRLIADANESWTPALLENLMEVAAETGFELVEQPLPAGADETLSGIARPVPICADEALHTRAELEALNGRYDAINIKLDKAGGLTEALDLMEEARRAGFRTMVGCMLATSLSIAPAMLLTSCADWVDLDGPLLLKRDRDPGLRYDGPFIHPPSPLLWG
jgi:L-alanine-DL-glutamate epimerase-like enolase superfamily enzyme